MLADDTARNYRRVWRLLSARPNAPISRIAQRLDIAPQTVTQAIRYLIACGYIVPVRARCGSERRIIVPFVVME